MSFLFEACVLGLIEQVALITFGRDLLTRLRGGDLPRRPHKVKGGGNLPRPLLARLRWGGDPPHLDEGKVGGGP